MDVFSVLTQSPLMSGFSADGVRIIQAASVQRQFPAGTPIFVEQMLGESAFIVGSGRVGLFLGNENLGNLEAYESFGEMSLIRPGPRKIGARSTTALEVIEIRRSNFLEVQKQRPQACLKLLLNIVDLVGVRSAYASPGIKQILEG